MLSIRLFEVALSLQDQKITDQIAELENARPRNCRNNTMMENIGSDYEAFARGRGIVYAQRNQLYRVAQKVSYYRESSLNRIKNRQPG